MTSPCTTRAGETSARQQADAAPGYPLDIPEQPTAAAARAAFLDERATALAAEASRLIGYPLQTDRQDHLSRWMNVFPNNLGDPDSHDLNDLHTKDLERAVIRYAARVAQGDPERTYGYIGPSTSHGILWALYLARRRMPTAIVYISAEAHFSAQQALDLLCMPHVVIPTVDHAMDPQALQSACAARPGQPAILLLTVGTTMWGAVDDVPALRQAAAVGGGDVMTLVDAALGGWLASAVDLPFGFTAGADVVLLSGHKMLLPEAAGIILARRDLVLPIPTGAYIGARNSTLGCSRSGTLVVRVWDALAGLGHDGLVHRALTCLATALILEGRLRKAGWEPWRHPASTTVVFRAPAAPEVCRRWHLPLTSDRQWAHIVVTPHLDLLLAAEFLGDLGTRDTGQLGASS